MKLNLGGGPKWKEQYPEHDCLDIVNYGQRYVGDVREILPTIRTENEPVTEVVANHFLEHFTPEDLKLIFSEVYRLLILGGKFIFIVPSKHKERAFILPHKTYWTEYTIKWLEEEDADKVYGFGRWEVLELLTNDRMDIYAVLEKR